MNQLPDTTWGALLVFVNVVLFLGLAPFFDGIVPVSYTHLDVYKRQRYDNLS